MVYIKPPVGRKTSPRARCHTRGYAATPQPTVPEAPDRLSVPSADPWDDVHEMSTETSAPCPASVLLHGRGMSGSKMDKKCTKPSTYTARPPPRGGAGGPGTRPVLRPAVRSLWPVGPKPEHGRRRTGRGRRSPTAPDVGTAGRGGRMVRCVGVLSSRLRVLLLCENSVFTYLTDLVGVRTVRGARHTPQAHRGRGGGAVTKVTPHPPCVPNCGPDCDTGQGIRTPSQRGKGRRPRHRTGGPEKEEKVNKADMTVERHSQDGFTIWYTDGAGCLCHKRFIGYTVREAKEIVRISLDEVAR